jgi:hypothetical protein
VLTFSAVLAASGRLGVAGEGRSAGDHLVGYRSMEIPFHSGCEQRETTGTASDADTEAVVR